MKNLHFILGNHLFPKNYLNISKEDNIILMAEDYELCTTYKYHKHKIVFYLSAMRSYRDELLKNGFNVVYFDSSQDEFFISYIKKILILGDIRKDY